MATRTEAVGIRLDAKLKAQLQTLADAEHRTLSNLVTMVLIAYCELNPKPVKPKLVNGHDHKAAKTASP